jgi:hypothetical protein
MRDTENINSMRRKETTMRQAPEGVQNEPVNSPLANGENTSKGLPPSTMVCVYGHGPTRNPFYQEAQALNATAAGALLVLNAPVSCGQRLLLMKGTAQDPAEAQVVRTRTLGLQSFEVEVAFPVPQPEFWQPFRETAKSAAQNQHLGAL